jgi:hypothetical protein
LDLQAYVIQPRAKECVFRITSQCKPTCIDLCLIDLLNEAVAQIKPVLANIYALPLCRLKLLCHACHSIKTWKPITWSLVMSNIDLKWSNVEFHYTFLLMMYNSSQADFADVSILGWKLGGTLSLVIDDYVMVWPLRQSSSLVTLPSTTIRTQFLVHSLLVRHVAVIQFIIHGLQILLIRFTQQNLCYINKFVMKHQQKIN